MAVRFLKIGSDGFPTEQDLLDEVEFGAAKLASLEVTGTVSMKDGADMNSKKITNLADGVLATDAVNKGQLDSVQSGLQSGLDAEIARATAAEAQLTSDLNAEISRAQAAELVLTNDLASEIARAQAAELVLTNDLASEIARAEAAELVLDGKITTEKNRAEAAEAALDSKIDAEIQNRIDAVAGVQSGLDAEIARAIAAEGVLTADLASEVSRATTAEQGLRTDLNAEIARAIAAEGVLDGKIDSEIARAVAAEAQLDGKIDTEISDRIAAVAGVQSSLDSEIARAIARENEIESDYLAAIAQEVTDRSAAVTDLQGQLDSEIARAVAAEGVLDGKITTEKNRAETVEAGLQAEIDAEETRALAAESQLNLAIGAEQTRAEAAEALLQSGLDTEIADRIAAVSDLQGQLDAEIALRGSEDIRILDEAKDYTDTVSGNALVEAKAYADMLSQGIKTRMSVYAVLPMSALTSLPGNLVSGERYLVKPDGEGQDVAAGIYDYNGTALVRSEGFKAGSDVSGVFAYVEYGVEEGTAYVVREAGPVVAGTSPVSFGVFSRAENYTFGDGLTKTGLNVSLNLGTAMETTVAGKLDVKLGTMSGMSIADGLQIVTQGALTTDGSGLKMVTDSTLVQEMGELKVKGLHTGFEIEGVAVSSNVSAANMSKLVDGGSADGLHTHENSVVVRDTALTMGGMFVAYSDTVSGNVVSASSAAAHSALVIGFGQSVSGGKMSLVQSGLVDFDMSGVSSLVIGEPMYLDANGGVCRLSEIPAGHYIVRVGQVHSSSKLHVQIHTVGKKTV